MSIDFSGLNARLLPQLPSLVPQWLPNGKREGREYLVGGLHGKPGRSLSINLHTGIWKDFASGEGGSDPISLYAALHNLGQAEAARQLGASEVPYMNGHAQPALSSGDESSPDETPPLPEPAPEYAAPPPREHGRYGESTAQWAYRDASGAIMCWVYRYDPEDARKQFVPYTWVDGTWVSRAPVKPRPLYGLDRLAARPQAPVLIAEGEKACEAAQSLFKGMVAVSWMGGAAAINTADWSVLEGRSCLIWPDNDDPGRNAAAKLAGYLLSLRCKVRVLNPEGQPDGWDAADWAGTVEELREWAKPRVRAIDKAVDAIPRAALTATRPPTAITVENDPPPDSAFALHQSMGLELNGAGRPHANIANAVACIARREAESGMALWYDGFRQMILVSEANSPGKAWSDVDSINLTYWLQSRMKLHGIQVHTVRDAVLSYAFAHQRNECREWLESLKWDGVERLPYLMCAGFGAERTPYTEAVGRCFMVGMVARVMRPGCKVDTLPVFEGPQGSYKSTALRIIGGEYFAEIHEQIGTKDFLQCLQGKMLLEISELSAFRKSDIERIKATISNCDDRFRAPYAREPADHPRQCVFAGTTNRTDWITDDTGARRFWPITCGEIDRDWITDTREQLFAEAVSRYRAGESWHDVPADEAVREQASRQQEDVWDDAVASYMKEREYATIADVLAYGLGVEPAKMTRSDQMRVGSILRRQGWERAQMRVAGQEPRKVWRIPQKKYTLERLENIKNGAQ